MEGMNYEKRNNFTINLKTIIRTLSLVCVVLVFCPAFLVSCSGQSASVSAWDVTKGISVLGTKASSFNPLFLLTLLLPLGIFSVFFLRKRRKTIALIIMICSVVDMLLWLYFRSQVKEAAYKANCDFESKFGFTLTVICLILIMISSALVLLNILSFNKNILNVLPSDGGERIKAWVDERVNLPQKQSGFCHNCGGPINRGNQFCPKCGQPVITTDPDDYEDDGLFCPDCGAENEEGSAFCSDCGRRL